MSIEDTKASLNWAIVRAEKAPFFAERDAWDDVTSPLYDIEEGAQLAINAYAGLKEKVLALQALSGEFHGRAAEIHGKIAETTAGSANKSAEPVNASAAELKKVTEYRVLVGAKVMELVEALEAPLGQLAELTGQVRHAQDLMVQENMTTPGEAQQAFIESATQYRDSL